MEEPQLQISQRRVSLNISPLNSLVFWMPSTRLIQGPLPNWMPVSAGCLDVFLLIFPEAPRNLFFLSVWRSPFTRAQPIPLATEALQELVDSPGLSCAKGVGGWKRPRPARIASKACVGKCQAPSASVLKGKSEATSHTGMPHFCRNTHAQVLSLDQLQSCYN